ncbi:hypothetical protein N7495_002938 [Penicillium taxi]|uniref:uncharacterized protein n=1 Tax=Penicillium taxi TaxID=168475 RepID=UPI00254598AC|nr:uncharacterized protein N7495_002938 [Penicillium taxi]KAJ5902410.1 hypothetical protein N7495_002938 [Penicillium taxi]
MSPGITTIIGTSILGISILGGFLFYNFYRREVSSAQSLNLSSDITDRYSKLASVFDEKVDFEEKLLCLGKKRADLIRLARGNVLEVSCGTGRNLEYYELGQQHDANSASVRSLTLVDIVPQMLDVAKEKLNTLYPEYKDAVTFRVEDAGSVSVELPSNRESSSATCYDTIVQTMGLCSIPDPLGTLKHLATIIEPHHGRILLLEHGRSCHGWINNVMDNLAPGHANRNGCWWNRDIGAIVRDSGLEIVEEKRWLFGIISRYILRPKQVPS